MENVILAAILSVCVFVLLGIVIAVMADRYEIVLYFALFGLIGGAIIGAYCEVENSSTYVSMYIVAKETIERSLEMEDLSGFERMELVNKATEYNRELAERKYIASKWYGCLEDERIPGLEYVILDSED